jgi:hypothetical protein
MSLIPKFRASTYLWPGIDGAANVLQAADKFELRRRTHDYFAELRAAYGRDVISLAFAIFGNEATFEHADHVKRNLSALQARELETPNLLPLFNLGLPFDRVASDSGVFRAHAIGHGLSPSGWRWLSQQKRATVRRLACNGLTPTVIAWLNLLAQAGAPLPAWLTRSGGVHQLSDLEDQVRGTLSQPETFKRSEVFIVKALRFALRSAQDPRLVVNRPLFLQQYEQFGVEVVRRFRTIQDKDFGRLSWTKFAQELEREHRERELAYAARVEAQRLQRLRETGEPEELQKVTWTCAIPDSVIRNITVRALCNNDQLVEEGTLMDHCLKDGTYLPMLVSGKARVFSMRGLISTYRATLLISQGTNGRWIVAQLKTFANASPPAIFHTVAKDICELYTKAAQ